MADTPIGDVSDTGVWVATYRALESERRDALFHDPLARTLTGERGRDMARRMSKSGMVGWAVVLRTVIIDDFVRELVSAGADTVLSLGAGLDTRPYRLQLPSSMRWIEVDYPKVIAFKNHELAGETPVCRLERIAVDLADSGARQQLFAEVAASSRRVVVITEGVIPYLTPEQVTDIARDLRAHPQFAHWIADYQSKQMQPHFEARARSRQMRNAPFRFFVDDWLGFFAGLGFVPRQIRYYGIEGHRLKRYPPLPIWSVLLWLVTPRRVRMERAKIAGYAIFEPKN